MQKRIVSLHYTAPPDIGGLEFAAFEVALAANYIKGYSGVLLTGTYNDNGLNESYSTVEKHIIPEISSKFPMNRKIFRDFRVGRDSNELNSLIKIIYDKIDNFIQPGDLIVSFNVFSLPYNIALTAALRLLHENRSNLDHLTLCYDLSIKESEYDWEKRDKFPWNLMWSICPMVKYAVPTTPMAHDISHLLNYDISKIKVIPAGTNIFRTLRVSKKIEGFYRKYNLVNKFPLIFVPAKMSYRKNLPRTINILNILREKMETAHLIIAGSRSPHDVMTDTYASDLKKMIKDKKLGKHVTVIAWDPAFDGIVLFEDSVSMMALSDVALFTSKRETFLIPILEAVLHGVPILAPKGQEVNSWAKKHAILYDPSSSDEHLSNTLLDILKSQNIKIKHLTRREYSWQNILPEFCT